MRRRVAVGQVVIAEVTLVGVALAAIGPAWLLVGVAAAGAAVLVATFGRTGGRWWYAAAASQRRFVRRRRQAAADVVSATLSGRTPATLVWLRTLAPGLTIHAVVAQQTEVGVAADQEGWFAAVAIDDGPAVTPAVLIELMAASTDRIALSTVQLIQAGRRAWVAVRLSPVDAVDVDGVARVETAIAAAAVRASRLLGEHGHPARALDAGELLHALSAANGLDAAPQERWAGWSSGRLEHTTYLASGWPTISVPDAVWAVAVTLGRLADSPSAGVGVAGVLLRVAAPPDRLAAACREVVGWAARAGLRLRRLDGDQAPAAWACGPTAIPANALFEALPPPVQGSEARPARPRR